MKLGIEHGMQDDAYRMAEGLSHSEAKLMRQKTPYHLHMVREHGPVKSRRPAPQLVLGSATHCLVLEPSTFEQRYCHDLDENRNSRVYREFAQECANAGLTPLSDDDRERVFGMRDALHANPQIADALSGIQPEVSAWFIDPASGVLCKMRADGVRPTRHGKGALLIDLKTTSDASPDAFSRSIHQYGYHTQCDWYVNGFALAANLQCDGMLFIVVESEFPFACKAYTLDEPALAQAARLNARVRATYAECMRTGIWPGYGDDVSDIGLPRWAYTQEKDE